MKIHQRHDLQRKKQAKKASYQCHTNEYVPSSQPSIFASWSSPDVSDLPGNEHNPSVTPIWELSRRSFWPFYNAIHAHPELDTPFDTTGVCLAPTPGKKRWAEKLYRLLSEAALGKLRVQLLLLVHRTGIHSFDAPFCRLEVSCGINLCEDIAGLTWKYLFASSKSLQSGFEKAEYIDVQTTRSWPWVT